jgi:DNA-binding MarR family transcriptional regulator
MSDPRVESAVPPPPGTARPAPALAETKATGSSLLFLREEEIRLAQDLLFFAYRDFTGAADVILDELGLGRAHHRALHFIGRNPQITVTELLGILRITKQSLARVLTALVDQGYVAQAPGRDDRRQRLLTLTAKGEALERRLFARQRERLSAAYRDAGGASVEGFRRVMRGIMNDAARAYMDRAEEAAHDGRPRQG